MLPSELNQCGKVKLKSGDCDSGLVVDIEEPGNHQMGDEDAVTDNFFSMQSKHEDFQLDSDFTANDSGFEVEIEVDNFKHLSISEKATSSERCHKTSKDNLSSIYLRKAEAVSKYCSRIIKQLPLQNRLRLVNEAFSPDEDGDTRLHLAVVHELQNFIFTLIYLVPQSSYFDLQNNLNQTALHLAVVTGQAVIVRILVLAGASTTVRDWRGNTPLHLACERGELKCVQELTRPITDAERKYLNLLNPAAYECLPMISVHPNLDIYNYEGRTCVHIATLNQRTDILLWLKQFGADINAQDFKSGRTPLTFAVELKNSNLVGFLVQECHADVEVKNYAGLSAFQIAYRLDKNIASQLQSFGAYSSFTYFSDTDSDLDVMDTSDEDFNFYEQPNLFLPVT